MTTTGIQWSDEFKFGLPAIDAEHRELVDLCNRFLDVAQTETSIAVPAAVLDDMISHTRAHFLTEERLLDRLGYPELVIHKAEHDRLLVQAGILRARLDEAEHENPELVRQLLLDTADFLQSWLLDHIKVTDRPYRPFLMNLI